jgi:hypothetical protein
MRLGNSHQSFEKVLTRNFPMTIDFFLSIFKNKKGANATPF